MKRRSFLSLLLAATAAPALPGGAAAKAVSYNRYTYGFAVFHARHGGAFGAAELAKTMKVTSAQAKAMIAQMSREGIVRPALGGTVQAVTTHGGRAGGAGFLRQATQTASDILDKVDAIARSEKSDRLPYESPTETRCNSDSINSSHSRSKRADANGLTDTLPDAKEARREA